MPRLLWRPIDGGGFARFRVGLNAFKIEYFYTLVHDERQPLLRQKHFLILGPRSKSTSDARLFVDVYEGSISVRKQPARFRQIDGVDHPADRNQRTPSKPSGRVQRNADFNPDLIGGSLAQGGNAKRIPAPFATVSATSKGPADWHHQIHRAPKRRKDSLKETHAIRSKTLP